MTNSQNTTRRSVLAALPATAIGVALPAGAEDIPDGNIHAERSDIITPNDATLLALGARFEELWAIEKEIGARDETPEEGPAPEFEAARDRTELVVREIATLDAETLAGLRVQARAATWLDDDDYWAFGVEEYEYRLRQKVAEGVMRLVVA
jgi:hypothetical protein